MGFTDLSLFNDAFLAIQTWRLLHDKSSLFYRVFKAKYFPDTLVMEAKIPANSSYAWKSIMKGRNVIEQGAKWRIGSGKAIHGVRIGCPTQVIPRCYHLGLKGGE